MGKRGFQPKPTCSKGHDIEQVGRTKSRNCKACLQEYHKIRQDFIREHFPKENKNNL